MTLLQSAFALRLPGPAYIACTLAGVLAFGALSMPSGPVPGEDEAAD